jgi:hypothetical protein
VELAWRSFAGANATTAMTTDELEQRYTRIDQRKNVAAFPSATMAVQSFVDFLGGYVGSCVAKYQHVRDPVPLEPPHERPRTTIVATSGSGASGIDAPVMKKTVRLDEPKRRPMSVPNSATAVPRRSSVAALPQRQTQQPPSRNKFEHVESKIRPQLQAQRDKLLRVKKNQTQRMKESLARARLDEYEDKARQETTSSSGRKRMPLDRITNGTCVDLKEMSWLLF